MTRLKLADTLLAGWLVAAMSSWVDPETRMPGLSQNRLAALSGVSQAQIHEILKKGHAPRAETLDKLASFFGVHPVRLYVLAYLEEDSEIEFWNVFFDMLQKLGTQSAEDRDSALIGFINTLAEYLV